MRPTRFSPPFAAARLRLKRLGPVLQLELPDYDRRFEPPPRRRDADPDALVLEADGSFTPEVRE